MQIDKTIEQFMKYYNASLAYIHEEEKDEWMYLLKDVLNYLSDLKTYEPRYVVSAMYFILTSDKEYTPLEHEEFYRSMRVWSKLDEVTNIAFHLVDLLVEDPEELDEEAINQILDVFRSAGLPGILSYENTFDMDKLYELQKDHAIDRNRIQYVEELFFQGNLNKGRHALDLAYSILHAEPYAYHVLIFLMDKVVHDGITSKSMSFLEAFIKTFKEVEEDWLKRSDKNLEEASDLREYCFALSSVAMFYLEEENYEKAIHYYEELIKVDEDNIFHAKEYILRAYMFSDQFDHYSDMLEQLPDTSVYKRLLLAYRKIQLYEEDLDTYLEEVIKDFGYLVAILIDEEDHDLSKLPEIEEDFIVEYGSLFRDDAHIVEVLKEFLEKHYFTA